ncbi:MAG: hypothetical protein OEZ01_06415, partial [Candidatus Heimdallarchaeota archaeon]|nr:hypothetical protein [Candidatus Heimdallarchaeota archaeon]
DNLIHDVTIFAMLNLCELLIAELTAFGEEIVLIEVKMISDKLYSIAEKQNSYYLLVETLIIKSKVALIEFDLEGSQKLLNEAMTFVNKFKLLHLSSKVEDQINKFRDTLNYWETYSNQNASLIERLKLSDLQEYMDKIFKMLPDVNASE